MIILWCFFSDFFLVFFRLYISWLLSGATHSKHILSPAFCLDWCRLHSSVGRTEWPATQQPTEPDACPYEDTSQRESHVCQEIGHCLLHRWNCQGNAFLHNVTSWCLCVGYCYYAQTVTGLCEMKISSCCLTFIVSHHTEDHLFGLMVRRPPRERKIPGSNPTCAGIFSGSRHTSDSKIGTPVATLPGAWHYRVSAGTGQPGISILWLSEVESLICNFYLSVAAHKIVRADPSLRNTSMLLER